MTHTDSSCEELGMTEGASVLRINYNEHVIFLLLSP